MANEELPAAPRAAPAAAPPGTQPIATRPRPAGGDLAFYREQIVLATEHSEGPLPSGRELQRYREADPSAPRIILREFRAEARHRREVERQVVTGENRRADRGQVFALVVMLVGLSFSALLIGGGHDAAGGFIAGLDLLGMAALFLTGASGAREHEHHRKAERKPMAGSAG